MNLGREMVAYALREKTLKPFLEAGIDLAFMDNREDMSRVAIFTETDRAAYRMMLKHWERHDKLPSMDLFRMSYPREAYRLPDSDMTADELIEMFVEDTRRYASEVGSMELADAVEAEDWDTVAKLAEQLGRKLRSTRASKSLVVAWDSPDYDVEARIARKVDRGIMTGIQELDDSFPGFQRGNLICYLGRAKAGKSSFFIMSAINSWVEGKRVLFLSFEIAAGKDVHTPGITDRMDAFAAGISFMDYTQGKLDPVSQRLLREYRDQNMNNGHASDMIILQPLGQYTIADLEYDIDRFEPDVVYIDGFYFMTDQASGESAAGWKGHDALAGDLKTLAMRRSLPVMISHQVREKQLQGKKGKGIDDGAMMGGTAIIMYADMVIGIDADEARVHTLSCTRSRTNYLPTVKGTWDWTTCTFTVDEMPDDKPKSDVSKFQQSMPGGDDDDD
jgi:hypothetical protein